MPKPRATFPRIATAPILTDGLSWFAEGTPGLDQLNVVSRGEPRSLLYRTAHRPGLVGVPRFCAPLAADDRRAVGDFEFQADFTATLRPTQVPFVNGVFDRLEAQTGLIAEAPTGFGKTVTGCALIARIGRPTCVVIPKRDLDWTASLLEHTTLKEDDVDYWSGQRLPRPDAKVVVASLQSIFRDGVYPREVFGRFACVIFDEVHRLGAPQFSSAIRKFPAMFRLGLSATAERRDGLTGMLRAHLGPDSVVGESQSESPHYFVAVSGWTPPGEDFRPDRSNLGKRSLMADPERNALIAGLAWRAHRAGRRTVVFFEQIRHLERIRASLVSMGVPEDLIVPYTGGSSAEEKARARECPAGVVVLGTYKMMAEGTDIPPLDTAVLAHPTYDAVQAVGRVRRVHPGKPTPVILDVVDPASPTLSRLHVARMSGLVESGAVPKGQRG